MDSILLQELVDEVRTMRRAIERLEDVLTAESTARQAWDTRQRQLAESLMEDSGTFLDSESARGFQTVPTASDDETGQEGPSIAATEDATHMAGERQGQNVTPATLYTPSKLEALYKEIENDWFIGKDGAHFIRGKGGQPDRRATAQEDRAIRHDQAKGKRGRR